MVAVMKGMKRMGQIVELDVRPYLRQKLEPFKQIMNVVDCLEPNDLFVLHATFKPTPLLGFMKAKGYTHKVEEQAEDHWIAAFAKGKEAQVRLASLSLRAFAEHVEEAAVDEQ